MLQPPDLVNQYAALPSLHLGWNLLVGIVLFGATRFWLVRVFAVLSPISMGCAIVLTGNHYLVDGILGCLVALTGLAASAALTPRLVGLDRRLRERLHQRRVVEDQPVHAPADQPPSGVLVRDRPGDDQAVRPLQLLAPAAAVSSRWCRTTPSMATREGSRRTSNSSNRLPADRSRRAGSSPEREPKNHHALVDNVRARPGPTSSHTCSGSPRATAPLRSTQSPAPGSIQDSASARVGTVVSRGRRYHRSHSRDVPHTRLA